MIAVSEQGGVVADTAVDQIYAYTRPSTCTRSEVGTNLDISTSSGGLHPHFFSGRLHHPRQNATLLLAVSRIPRTRFYVPPAMLAAGIALADPVVTANGDRLRFEAFSACAGAYARLDLLQSSLDGVFCGHGTTNVDFNAPMQAALARVTDTDEVLLDVGGEEVALTSAGKTVVERRVPLPARWVKGFAEVQLAQAEMFLVHELGAAEASRFLRSIPAGGGSGHLWAVPAGSGLRLSGRPGPTGVAVGGADRLRALGELVRYAKGLRVYGNSLGASAWELIFPGASFHLVLSPELSRGFSGEGRTLSVLTDPAADSAAGVLRAALGWEASLDPVELALRTGLAPAAVTAGLGLLAVSGLVGYDLALGTFFHRELPFDTSRLLFDNPRLRDARRLVDAGSVRVKGAIDRSTEALVASGGVEHLVRLGGAGWSCSCPWYSRHQAERGPCKHILATQMAMSMAKTADAEG